MIATGRIPNTDLALEETGVELGERGEIKVNEHLQTSVEHIYRWRCQRRATIHLYLSGRL